MKRLVSIFFALIILGLFFYAFKQKGPEADPTESYQSYLDGKSIFIDVREENEVKEGMIKGAMWLPLSKIKSNKDEAIAQIKEMADGKEILVYCKSGNRSGKVKKILNKAGIESLNMGG